MLRKSIKVLLLTTFSFIVCSGCNNKEKLNSSQKNIIKECINKVIYGELKSMNESYLVKPYFQSFAFNNYTVNNYDIEDVTCQNKREVLEELNLTEDDFNFIQRNIDKKYTDILSRFKQFL